MCRRWIDEISDGSTDGESARLNGVDVFAVPRVWRCCATGRDAALFHTDNPLRFTRCDAVRGVHEPHTLFSPSSGELTRDYCVPSYRKKRGLGSENPQHFVKKG